MKRNIIDVFVIIIIFTFIGIFILQKNVNAHTETSETINFNNKNVIKTATPNRKSFTESCHWFGKVKSDKIKIIALTAGEIISIPVKNGDYVARGDLLFIIGGELLKSQMNILQDKSNALQEQVKLAEEVVKVKSVAVKKKFAKYEELASAKKQLAISNTKLEENQQTIMRLKESTHLHAPINGVFSGRKVSVGQAVQAGNALAEIIPHENIYIEATMFADNKNIKLKGKQAIINLAGGDSIKGNITTVLPQKTEEGATVVQITGDKLSGRLSPGQMVSGTVILFVHKNSLSVPEDAVVRDGNEQAYLFLKDAEGYHKQPIKTGLTVDRQVEVVSGLNADDKVVVQGAYELFYQDFNKIYKVVD